MIPAVGKPDFAARLRPALPVVLVLALATLALWPSVISLLRYWGDIKDYEHGFFVAAIALVWVAHALWRAAAAGSCPEWKAGLLMAPLLLTWIVTVRGGIDIAHQLLWPLVMGLSVWAVAGQRVALRLAPAIGLLYAAIPVWDYGLPVLQRLSIFFSEHILALLGVPAAVSENYVTIPEGTFAIVEGCSGKRYFVVTLAVAYLAIFFNHIRGWRALLFLAMAGLLSMLMNWIRIVIVIYAGHVTDMQSYLVAQEHLTLGNVLFVVLIAVVLLLGHWISPRAVAPVPEPLVEGTAPTGVFSHTMLAPALMLLVAMQASHVGAASGLAPRLAGMPLATGAWQGPLPPQAGWQPSFSQADDQRRVAYSSPQGTVEVYVNLYLDQRDGREMVNYVNKLIAPALWTGVWDGSHTFETGGRLWSQQLMDGPDSRRWIVVYGYLVRNRMYRSDIAAKLAYGWYSIFGAAPSSVLAAATVCETRNCNNARMLVADFWNNMQLPMEAMVPDRLPVTP